MDNYRHIECTEVLKMERDFEDFISGQAKSNSRKKPTNTSGLSPMPLHLDESAISDHAHSVSTSRIHHENVTIGSLMEKEKEIKRKAAELSQAKATIAGLENRIVNIETSRKRQRIEYEEDLDSVQRNAYIHKDKLEELKGQLHSLMKSEKEARSEMKELRSQLSANKTNLGAQISELRKDKISLEAKLDEMDCLSRNQIMQLKNEKMRQETEMEICRSETSEAQEQLGFVQKRCNELKTLVRELEEYRSKALEAEVKAKDLQGNLDQIEDDALITKTMKGQLARLSDLERENRQLKEENSYCKNTKENIHLLREELDSAKRKLTRSEARASEAETLRATCEDLQERLQKWEDCHIPGSNRPKSPTEMSRQIAHLQQTSLLTFEKQGELQANERLMAHNLEAAQVELKLLRTRLAKEQKKTEEQNGFIKRIQKKLLLLKKERDGYKQVLDSYESATTTGGARAAPSQLRIKQLEETLQSYRSHLSQLEKQRDDAIYAQREASSMLNQMQLDVQNSFHHQPVQTTSDVDQKIISSLREQVAEAGKELHKVADERDTLAARIEQRHLQGDFDPTKTKVIHMTFNPTSIAQDQRKREMGKLKEDNKSLQERLTLLEESGGQVDDLTVKVQEKLTQPSSSEELEAMKASLNTAELKYKRLMEAFKVKSQEFREVCFQLLGYKIDIPTDKQYRLMNIYAEGPGEYILFHQNNDGGMQLLSNDYSSTLEEKIETYLTGANSIPAFLSSITMMLFNRQTMFQESTLTA